MPYRVAKEGEQFCVVGPDGKKMGCHPSEDKANAQVRALYANEALSQIVWVDPFAYQSGKPIRLFPITTAKRGNRTIDVTAERLKQMEANYNAGRPRWRIPLYFGHPTDAQPDPPKAGNISRLEFREGDGLYGHPEYTESGKKSVEGGEYQYVSPGVLWSIAGGSYADENGQEFDNVIDHVALTNRPFFGGHTAIFSSDETLMRGTDVFSQIKDAFMEFFRDFTSEERKKLSGSGAAMKDGSYPIENESDLRNAVQAFGRSDNPEATKAHIVKRARALGKTSLLPDEWKENMAADKSMMKNMDDEEDDEEEDPKTPKKKAEDKPMMKGKMNMSDSNPNVQTFGADEVKSMIDTALKAQKDQFDATFKTQQDALAAQKDAFDAQKKQTDEFAAQLAAQKMTARKAELRAVADTFSTLPISRDEYADKFAALEQKDPDLFKWFSDKFAQFETLVQTDGLFAQFSRENARKAQGESIETLAAKISAEEFKADKSRYSLADAMIEAGKRRPDLAIRHVTQ